MHGTVSTKSDRKQDSSEPECSFAVTTFPNKAAASKSERTVTLHQLETMIHTTRASTKLGLPWLKLARFGALRSDKRCLRRNSNVVAITGVELDYDGGDAPMEMAVAANKLREAGVRALVYTTPSHTPEKPRWRALCPTSRELEPKTRANLVNRLHGVLRCQADPSSWTLSQTYVYGSIGKAPAPQSEVVEGRCIDEMAELDATALGKDARPPPEAVPEAPAPPSDAPTEVSPELASALAAIPSDERDDWLKVGMALHHHFDGSEVGFEAWDEWSESGDGYVDEADQRRTWDGFTSDRDGTSVTVGTIYKMAAKHTPLPDWEAMADDSFECEENPAKGDGLADLDGFALNEDGVALAFRRKFKNQLRYDHDAGQWLRWTGTHWQREGTRLAFEWARNTARSMAPVGKPNATTRALARAATAAAVERFAQSDRAFAVTSEVWDQDPMLLGTPGGTVELLTGALRPARQGDCITKLTAVAPVPDFDPDLDCPQWLAFLRDATGGDDALIRLLQQWCGYALTGDTREHALLFICGPGGNGKSVFLNTITGIMADLCRTAGMEVFTTSKNGPGHPQELARLKGARMVCATETEEGRAWAEVRIKQLTGGDKIAARFMRENDFEFRPEFKLTIVGNHKPVLNSVDEAVRRRFNVVPFEHKSAKRDARLERKLRTEWPGILAWMIAGCLDWQKNGLVRPKAVLDATAAYMAGQDTFQHWLDDQCEVGSAHVDTTTRLYDDWSTYAHGRGATQSITSRTFADTMGGRGFTPIKDTLGIRGRGYRGLRLRPTKGDALV